MVIVDDSLRKIINFCVIFCPCKKFWGKTPYTNFHESLVKHPVFDGCFQPANSKREFSMVGSSHPAKLLIISSSFYPITSLLNRSFNIL